MQHTNASRDWFTPVSLAQPLRGDLDASLDFEIKKMTTRAGESSLIAFQMELPDQEQTRYQVVLFHDPTGISRLVVHHQCIPAKTGVEESIESHSVILKTLTGLRIVRRGRTVTIVATSPDYGSEFVLAQFERPLATLPEKLNVFVRAGGADGEISVLLKKLLIRTQAREPLRPPEPQ